MADETKKLDGPGRELEGDGQSSGLPALGEADIGQNEPLGARGLHHWKEATVTETSLQSRGSVFFAAVEMTRMPMAITDPRQPDNPVVFVNRAFLDLTGYEEDEILGRNCRFLQGAQTDPRTVAELQEALAEHRPISVEILNYKRDGSPFWNALFVAPVYDPGGEILYWFSSQLDVSRRKNSEQSLRQAQKMESIGQLTAGLAHDFNNLLQVVTGNLERLRKNPPPDRAARYLENASTAAERGARITRQLLAFARKTRLEPQPVDISDLVRGIEEMIDSTLGGQVEFHLSLRRRLPPACVDPTHLEMALINLLLNARDASRPDGLVTISTAPLKDPPDGRGLPPGEYVVLCVEDEGVGMPPHVVERATEPFFSTKSPDQGTGLGLAMVSGFVQQSRGKLEIDSELGRGTVVKMILPVHDSPGAPAEPDFQPVSATVVHGHSAHVLAVDDHAEVLDIAVESLTTLGYCVSTAANAEEALRVFEAATEAGRPIDLLFSDIIMPGGMNGIALADEVLKRNPAVKVLLATGYNEDLVDGPARRGLDVLGKPYRHSELADRVGQALRSQQRPGGRTDTSSDPHKEG